MGNSLENKTVVRIKSSVDNSCELAEASCAVSARVFANIRSDGIPAEAEEPATDDTAVITASMPTESLSHLMLTAVAVAGSSSFPMAGAGLANIRNEL
jgi:hypothetical protein